MLRAVIFDFDGVITDSEIVHLRSFNEVLGTYAVHIDKHRYYRDYLGLTDEDLFKRLIKEGETAIRDSDLDKLLREKKQVYEQLIRTDGKLIGGVREFLEKLKCEKIHIAICSGALKTEIELILEQARLRDYFETIVSAENTRKGKPHPEGFLLTLKRLNKKSDTDISAEQCIAIEDSHWGLKAAKAAGMHTVAITNSYDARQLKDADKIADHLDELTMEKLRALCR